MGWEKYLPPGEALVACFRPFLEYLAASDLSRKTIQKHVDNMWVLGGEIIRDLNQTPSLNCLTGALVNLAGVTDTSTIVPTGKEGVGRL